jgi:hypothetical protein
MIIAPPPVPPRGTAAFEHYNSVDQARWRRFGPVLEIATVVIGLALGCAGAAAILISGGWL